MKMKTKSVSCSLGGASIKVHEVLELVCGRKNLGITLAFAF